MKWSRDGDDWPHRERSRFVEAGGITWHVQSFGDAADPVCLLLHGTAATTHSWEGLAPLLATRCHVVSMDLPGHGFTQCPPTRQLSLPGMAGLVAALCDALETKPALMVGHSAGAAVALQMALDGLASPERIIGINAALMPFKGIAGQVFPPLAKMLFVNPVVPHFFSWNASTSRVERLLGSTGSRLSPRALDYYRRLLGNADHVGAALGMMAHWDLAGLQRRWGNVPVPLHLIVGTNDGTVPPSDAREIAKGIAGVTTHPLQGLGHLAHEEAPDRVAEIVFSLTA